MSLIWTPDHVDRLLHLAETADRIVVGTAYLTANPLAEVLRSRASSVPVTVVAGVSTNTDHAVGLALRMAGAVVKLVPRRPGEGSFHAKVYGFMHGGEGTIVVGSGNLTGGAFFPDGNVEAFTVLAVAAEDVAGLERKLLTLGTIDDLDVLHEVESEPDGDHGHRPAPDTRSALMSMSWPQFVAALHARNRAWAVHWGGAFGEGNSWFDTLARLRTLDATPLRSLSESQRRILAGAPMGKVNPGFFGELRAAGAANGHIQRADDASVVKVIDQARRSVGRVGEPLSIDQAMHAADSIMGLSGFAFAAASRLLGAVRPDVYVILNNASLEGVNSMLSDPFPNIDWSAANRRRYRAVLETVQTAPWWNAPRPRGPEAFIWDGRALLLDIFFYDANVG